MKPLACGLVPLVLLVSTAGFADVPAEHDLIVTGDFAVSIQHVTSSTKGSDSIDLIRIAPSFDWVATRGLTIGAWLVYEHQSSGGNSADDYGIIPRVGYAAELGPKVFVWPRAGIGYLHGVPDLLNIAISSSSLSLNRWQLDLDVPFLYTPVPHFFIGGGPLFRVDLSSSASSGSVSVDASKLTAFGLTTMIGGYF